MLHSANGFGNRNISTEHAILRNSPCSEKLALHRWCKMDDRPGGGVALWSLAIQPASDGLATSDNSTLIAAFRRVEVSSVSDAIEQLIGRRMYMSHRMTPIFTTKFAGWSKSFRGKLSPELL